MAEVLCGVDTVRHPFSLCNDTHFESQRSNSEVSTAIVQRHRRFVFCASVLFIYLSVCFRHSVLCSSARLFLGGGTYRTCSRNSSTPACLPRLVDLLSTVLPDLICTAVILEEEPGEEFPNAKMKTPQPRPIVLQVGTTHLRITSVCVVVFSD
jgi:hypothetical protein